MMTRHFAFLLCIIGISSAISAAEQLPPAAQRQINFAKDIKPLLETSCVSCHGKGKSKGGFNLDTRQAFLKGGDSSEAAVPGNSADSYVVRLVAGVDPDEIMPKKGTRWTAEQVGLFRAWIDQGMPWDPGVTFARPAPVNLTPRVVALPAGESKHPIDRLLASYFSAKNVTPPPVIEDRIFARRVYLDSIGLLPTPRQMDDFLADPSPEKRTALVRRLLSDHRGYADHWLTFWNDLLRNDYRGTGFIDGGRRQISGWLYSALLANKPYDQFVAELVNPTRASEGFSRGIIWRGTVNASMLPPVQAAQNVSQVFMGVNLKCASCHDSFINDWTLADAYGLAAIYSEQPLELVHCDKPTGKLAEVRFLYPQLGGIDAGLSRRGRLSRLGELMTSRDNGRLSRTIVNRLWARLLGRGLVEPLDDMEQPAWNVELLDWLAEDLVAHKYDLKHTIEMILTSQAYQLPLAENPPTHSQAPYVFRGPLTRRLTAEQFADALTSFTGDWARWPSTIEFDFTAGGLVSIQTPTWIWTDEPVDLGQQRAFDQARRKAEEAAMKAAGPTTAPTSQPTSRPAVVVQLPPRHRVGFRKTFDLEKLPREAYAALAASQSFNMTVNNKHVGAFMSDGHRHGRIQLFDLRPHLQAGENSIVLDISSHTEQPAMTEEEQAQYPQSRHHLNRVSGVAFYLHAAFDGGGVMEVVTDQTWRTRRAPDNNWKAPAHDDSIWRMAVALPDGVTPVDEGVSLPPIRRKDFSTEPIEVGLTFRAAASTAAQPGRIRAALLASDPLMAALDRPNREQVMTSRSTAATTIQALELTNGNTLNARLSRLAGRLHSQAARDPSSWVSNIFRHALSRPPTDVERQIVLEMLGQPVKTEAVADFLWSLVLLPEFQLIN